MRWGCPIGAGLAALILGAVASAQEMPQPGTYAPALPPLPAYSGPATASPAPQPSTAGSGLESHSLPGEITEDTPQARSAAKLGPTAVSDVRFLMDRLGLENFLGDSGIRVFGWTEVGYSGASSGTGPLSVQPRLNRFGNEFLFNQIGLTLQKPLRQDQLDFGFNIRYFAGADAATGQPLGGIGYPVHNSHFGQDFRDLYVSAHLPILTEGGLDVKFGRQNTIIGYNGFLSPYRPFYSSDYQFFYSQDGAFTGVVTDLHVNPRLDLWNGVTLGANTFFTKRTVDTSQILAGQGGPYGTNLFPARRVSNSICYIGQVNYWLTDEQKTRLTASVYAGPNALFAAPGLSGVFDTMVELRIQQDWNKYFTQVVQSNMGWDSKTAVGTGQWYGVYTIGIFHVYEKLDAQFRAEWFYDVRGTRTGFDTSYEEVTLGLNWHPVRCLEFRPEIRGDFAGVNAFGANGNHNHDSQLTGGISALLKF